MRQLIVSMNMTLDGFMSGPDHGLDWHFTSWTEEMAESACEQLSRADTILLGRITYDAMAAYWPVQAAQALYSREDIAFADMMNHYEKIVFSKTLDKAGWSNSRVVKDSVEEEIVRLKNQRGREMIIYGSGKLVDGLLKAGLVDEFRIWLHPVLIGKGKRLFKTVSSRRLLTLFDTKRFGSGVVVLYYKSRT
jgi:dihydrofolate reductase